MLRATFLIAAMVCVHSMPAVSGVSVPKIPAGGFCEESLS